MKELILVFDLWVIKEHRTYCSCVHTESFYGKYQHRLEAASFFFFIRKGKYPSTCWRNKQTAKCNYYNIQYIWFENCSSFPWSAFFFFFGWEWRQDCTEERKTTERWGCWIIVVEWIRGFCLVCFHGFSRVPHPAKMWAEDIFREHKQVQVSSTSCFLGF